MPTDADILRQAITASGLSARRFAVIVLWRDERTVRRWLAGDAMPAVVRDGLIRWMTIPAARRSRMIDDISRRQK